MLCVSTTLPTNRMVYSEESDVELNCFACSMWSEGKKILRSSAFPLSNFRCGDSLLFQTIRKNHFAFKNCKLNVNYYFFLMQMIYFIMHILFFFITALVQS